MYTSGPAPSGAWATHTAPSRSGPGLNRAHVVVDGPCRSAIIAINLSAAFHATRAVVPGIKALGRAAADEWLGKHGDNIGCRSTFNYARLVAAMTQDSDDPPTAARVCERD